MLVNQLESKFSNFLPSFNLTIFVLSLSNSSTLCNFQQFGCGQFLQFLSVSLFILRNVFLVINGLSFPLLVTFLVLLGFFLVAMLLKERCTVVYVGCVALGVALADVLVLLPALLGELGRALGGVLGLALLSILGLALLIVLCLALLGVFRLALSGVLGLALLDVLSLALLLVLGLALLLDLLLALGGVLGLALVLVLGLTMIIISRGAVRLGVLF